MMILPTRSELDAALTRAAAAWTKTVGTARQRPITFDDWCATFIVHGIEEGPLVDAAIIGADDARLLVVGFDLYMRHAGHDLRAQRVGF